MSKEDYQYLLKAILNTPEFSSWQSSGHDKYRDYNNHANAFLELSQFGLYDHKNQTQVESLVHLAKRLGVSKARQTFTQIEMNGHGEFDSLIESAPKIKPPPPETPPKTSKKKKGKPASSRTAIASMLQKLFGPSGYTASLQNSEWMKKSSVPLWSYFVESRNCIVPEKRKALQSLFFRKMRQMEAHFYTWTNQETGQITREIRIPMRGVERNLVQLMRIQIDEHNKKIAKKVFFEQSEPRAIFFGEPKSDTLIITEGIEDALSLAFNLNDGSSFLFCVIGGKNGFRDLGGFLSERLANSSLQKILIVCDKDKEDEGLKASMALGGEIQLRERSVPIQRLVPVEIGLDPNKILNQHGPEVLQNWFDSRDVEEEGGFESVNYDAEIERLEAEKRRLQLLSKGNPSEYNFTVHPLTHSGAAQAFLDKYKEIVRITEDGRWWVYDEREHIWSADFADKTILSWITGLSYDYREILQNDPSISDEEVKKWKAFIESLGSSMTATGIMKLIAGSSAIRCRVSDFDSNPDIINIKNGIIKLEPDGTHKLLPHDSGYMCSLRANVSAVDPNGLRPEKFLKFLSDISGLPSPDGGDPIVDEEMIAYWQRVCGYMITGHTNEKMLFFCFGEGGDNGKSMLSNVLQGVLGTYAGVASGESFMKGRITSGSNASPDIAALAGQRLVVAAELESRMTFNEGLIKTITGNEEIRARFLNKNFFKFRPRFKLLFHGNSRPKVEGTDPAIWRRQQMIPFEITIPKAKQIPDIDKMLLSEEGDLIFNWMLEGYKAWREEGIKPPARVHAENENYRKESDTFDAFLGERCILWSANEGGKHLGDFKTEIAQLRTTYLEWCLRSKITAQNGTPNRFPRMLAERGFEVSAMQGSKYVIGVKLKSIWQEEGVEIEETDVSWDADLM